MKTISCCRVPLSFSFSRTLDNWQNQFLKTEKIIRSQMSIRMEPKGELFHCSCKETRFVKLSCRVHLFLHLLSDLLDFGLTVHGQQVQLLVYEFQSVLTILFGFKAVDPFHTNTHIQTHKTVTAVLRNGVLHKAETCCILASMYVGQSWCKLICCCCIVVHHTHTQLH